MFSLPTLVSSLILLLFFLPYMLFGPHGLGLLSDLSLLAPYPLTALYIYLFVKFRPAAVNILSLPWSFVLLPVPLYILLVFLRRILDVRTCAGGWEILAGMAIFFYSIPFLIVSIIAVMRHR